MSIENNKILGERMVTRRRKNVPLYVVKTHKIGGYFCTFNKNSGIIPLSVHISVETFLLWDPQKAFFPCLYEGVLNSEKCHHSTLFPSTHLSFLGTKHSLKYCLWFGPPIYFSFCTPFLLI